MTPNEHSKVAVVVVDSHPIWRAGICNILSDTQFSIVGEASSFENAALLINQILPQLLLLGPGLIESERPNYIWILRALSLQVILAILTDMDNADLHACFPADGVIKYLPKSIGCRELVDALTALVANKRLVATRKCGVMDKINRQAYYCSELLEPLTHRELEVLCLLTAGLSNTEIANKLFVAKSTIKTHVEHIIHKLGVTNRVQAVTWAIRQGLICPTTSL